MAPARKNVDTTTYSRRIANRLRQLRDESGMGVEQIVERIQKFGFECKEANYRHWENGTSRINIDAIPAVAKALKVKPHDLLPNK